jgi:hypothetical protein
MRREKPISWIELIVLDVLIVLSILAMASARPTGQRSDDTSVATVAARVSAG